MDRILEWHELEKKLVAGEKIFNPRCISEDNEYVEYRYPMFLINFIAKEHGMESVWDYDTQMSYLVSDFADALK